MFNQALVVDDNYYNRDLARLALDTAGFNVEEAENGREALDLLKTQTYHLLILDIEMPEIDGIEVFKTLRKDPRHQPMKVVIMTAYRNLAEPIVDEVDYIIYKPIAIADFVVFLSRLILGKL